ncbi:uncharacterized protein BP5553_07676 [Venustampulla echinocandica]|uniref:Diphthine--ammonia ligase n=1 Tax=Venustampulla echinocandica TaxID=2656787 RepID=A0A370TH77_9HELO|nr:uncharacterized protein BP5553_07676 [Venustampulla echinocandica]RDL34548.1 hypothetical protein BP5553_07676 [Venustampulla echinocandica]
MAESLNVIALISGGKDSFFSLLHCVQNGHKVVALANLYPAPTTPTSEESNHGVDNEEEHDLNSFMYQTVGHTVIPLYAQALQIPLYREPIVGTAAQTGASYAHDEEERSEAQDETESLVPLLRRIIAEHPTANALSTGAILSTYQRTRVESVALRLGLTPLGFLWKYPILPPGTQISLLEDMQSVGLDARIVKVASGGLDESFLWGNVASPPVMRRVEKCMKRFGTDGDGAVLGEGGEFETLVIDGPSSLFKGKIVILEEDRSIVREGGGAAWLRIRHAEVVMKNIDEAEETLCRLPGTLDQIFSDALGDLDGNQEAIGSSSLLGTFEGPVSPIQQPPLRPVLDTDKGGIVYWVVNPAAIGSDASVSQQASSLLTEIQKRLTKLSLQSTDIISTLIILRSMQDFTVVNKIYSTLFTKPNPPARVTISCGTNLPENTHLIIHLRINNPQSSNQPTRVARKALHVQSRSYWAPANIGPYSQAISIPLPTPSADSSGGQGEVRVVAVAGQIPLTAHTMAIPHLGTKNSTSSPLSAHDTFLADCKSQTVLALQHLWRIGEEMDVGWWTSAVAYLPAASAESNAERASIAGQAWRIVHCETPTVEEDGDGEERDLWEEKYYAGMAQRGAQQTQKLLPDWNIVKPCGRSIDHPPFFAVEVDELPRQSSIEWHAHMGVVNGPVTIHPSAHNHRWSLYQCTFGGRLQSIIAIEHLEPSSETRNALHEALEALGMDDSGESGWFASYVDVSVQGAWGSGVSSGMIPCTRIWGGSGNRLGAVLIIGTVAA